MKHFIIKYRRQNGTPNEWHAEIARFISALDNDPDLTGKIAYRCMKSRDGADYFHLATVADDQAVKALQSRNFFSHYSAKTKQTAGGELEVLPLEIIAETRPLV